jgi:hypothetical protein
MRIKIQRQKKLDIPTKLQSVIEIKDAISFLEPELTADEVKDKLLFALATIANSELLNALHKSTNELANKKVDEVSDLYCSFFSDDYNDNNN